MFSFEFYWYLSIVIFILILAVMVYRDRRNFKRESILLLRRTQTSRNFIVRLGNRFPRFWKGLGTVSAIVGIFVSIWALLLLIQLTVNNFFAETATPGLALLLPSPTPQTIVIPGVIAAPFWYWIIAIALLVVVHEGLHGIMAAMEKVKIKSLGWGLLAIIPLAFVEPDEKALEKRGSWPQLRVFSAGSFANFLLAGVSILITVSVFAPMFTPGGVAYQGLIVGYPAAQVNMTGVIVGIDNHTISSLEDLDMILTEIGPGKEITIHTMLFEDGEREFLEFTLVTAENPDNESSDKGFIGIGSVSGFMDLKEGLRSQAGVINFFLGLLYFLVLINLGVGIANLLPLLPLDGGKMWYVVFRRFVPKHSKKLIYYLSYVTLVVLIMAFALPIVRSVMGI